jgi:hypothetical protein
VNIATRYEAIHFRGDSIHPGDGEHDLRLLVAEAVALRPNDRRDRNKER